MDLIFGLEKFTQIEFGFLNKLFGFIHLIMKNSWVHLFTQLAQVVIRQLFAIISAHLRHNADLFLLVKLSLHKFGCNLQEAILNLGELGLIRHQTLHEVLFWPNFLVLSLTCFIIHNRLRYD